MSKKLLTLVLALVMVLGTFTGAFADEAVTTSAEVKSKIEQLIESGYIVGDGNGDYALESNITRAELAVIVVRAMGLEELSKVSQSFPSKFKDMQPGHWANGYVNVAVSKNIIAGYTDGTFKPEANISYAEVATMLTRVIQDLTEAEKANAVWPLTYLTKAASLGILNEVLIEGTYNDVAVRQQAFEMLFNTVTKLEDINLDISTVMNGVIIENQRTDSLAKNELTIKLNADEVKKDGSKAKNEKGDEVDFKLTEEFAKVILEKGLDVEELLGKGVEVSFDKAGKVVKIEITSEYSYITGVVEEVTVDSIKLEGKTYKIGNDSKDLLGSFFNNQRAAFDNKAGNFVSKVTSAGKDVLVRATVRAGKLIYVEAFAFEDIAPVAKAIDAKGKVEFYADNRNGSINSIVVDETAVVLKLVDGKLLTGKASEIAENDVIHFFYADAKRQELVVIVRPAVDAIVEGVYTQVTSSKDKTVADILLEVDKKDLKADFRTNNRNAVYSASLKDKEFYTLSSVYENELAAFADKTVTVLLDAFGKVQLISADTINATSFGIITDTYGSEFKILVNNKAEWYTTARDTKFVGVGTGSSDSQIKGFRVGDIVTFTAAEKVLTKLEKVVSNFGPSAVTKINENAIEFASDLFYIGAKTSVIVKDAKGDFVNVSVKDFIKNYDTKLAFDAEIVRNDRDGRLADFILVTNAKELVNVKYEVKTVKVEGVVFRGTEIRLTVLDGKGEVKTHLVNGSVAEALVSNREVVAGSVIEVTVTKDDKAEIKEIAKVFSATEPVFFIVRVEYDRARGENVLTLLDANNVAKTIYVARDAEVFGDLNAEKYVALGEIDAYNTVKLADVRTYRTPMAVWADPNVVAANKVTVEINALPKLEDLKVSNKPAVVAARKAFTDLTVEQKALVLPATLTKLTDAENKISELETGNANQVLANPVINKINALPLLANIKLADKVAVDAARAAFAGLTADQQALVTNIDKLTDAEDKLVELQADVDAAELVIEEITELPTVEAVELLQADAVANAVEIQAVEDAVVAARASFDALTESQQALVTNVNLLVALEALFV